MNTMRDAAGRTKRRGNWQPLQGQTYRVRAMVRPLGPYCTHEGVINGHVVDRGTPETVRETLYRRGADEEPEGSAS